MQYRKALQMDGNHPGAHEKIARMAKESEMKAVNQAKTFTQAAPPESDIILIP
jgi:hypothetical protein